MTTPTVQPAWPAATVSLDRVQELSQGDNHAGPGIMQASNDLEALQAFLWTKRGNDRTLESYRRECQRFLLWSTTVAQRSLGDMRPQDLEDYIKFSANPPIGWCGNARGKELKADPSLWRPFTIRKGPLSANSIKTQLAILKSIFSFLHSSGYLRLNPMVMVSTKALLNEIAPERATDRVGFKKVWTLEQWQVIKQTLSSMPTGTQFQLASKHRMMLWVVLIYEGALRISDLVDAYHGDIVWNEPTRQWVFLLQGKGDKVDALPMTERAMAELTRYRVFHGQAPMPTTGDTFPLLAHVQPMTDDGNLKPSVAASEVRRALKAVLKKAGAAAQAQDIPNPEQISNGSLHSIRHRRAQNLLTAGTNLRTVQSILRHSKIETTAIYTDPDAEQRKQAMESDEDGL